MSIEPVESKTHIRKRHAIEMMKARRTVLLGRHPHNEKIQSYHLVYYRPDQCAYIAIIDESSNTVLKIPHGLYYRSHPVSNEQITRARKLEKGEIQPNGLP